MYINDMEIKKVTQKQRQDFIREKLKNNDIWAKRALLKIFENQTQDEQTKDNVKNHNGIGFRPCDVFIMSRLAKFLIEKNYLSPKQMNIVHKKIPVDSRQIEQISDIAKINQLINN